MPANQTVSTEEHRDVDSEKEWRRFIDSGLPGVIKNYGFAHALFALVDSGLGARLQRGGGTAAELGGALEPLLVEGLLRYLTIRGVVTRSEATPPVYDLSARGRDITSDLSVAQLGFFREAYGAIFEQMSPLLTKKKAYPADVERDGGALARHCATGFHYFGTNVALKGLQALGADSFIDLGCGAAGFLIDACKQRSDIRCVGLDISADAIDVARREVAQAGLTDRIQLFVGDAFQPATWPSACREVGAITMFGALHEHFRKGENAVVELLDTYARTMDGNPMKGMILGEPEIAYNDHDADFYLMHVFTNQGTPRARDGWLPIFEKTKLVCESVFVAKDLGPAFAYYVLKPRA